MKKIIYWIDNDFLQYGIALAIQKKFNHEAYAIYELPTKTKKFFEKQNLVTFKKVWFYHNFIIRTSEPPDLNYLADFEQKYGIHLWLIAQNERLFFDYNNYYKFSTDEILKILEQECKLFEKILDEVTPDFLCSRVSDLQHNHIFYKLCQAKGIKPILFATTRVGYKAILVENVNKELNLNYDEVKKERSSNELKNYLKSHNSSDRVNKYQKKTQNSKIDLIKASILFLTSSFDDVKTNYYYYGRTKSRVLFKELLSRIKKRYRKWFIDNNLTKIIDTTKPFVYFPLHDTIDRVLLIGAPFYTNQLEMIKNIVKSLPIGYQLYVKEHPIMNTRRWRPLSFYKQVMNLPHVQLFHPSVKNEDMLEKCSLVITITGTSSLEAALTGKPSIVFTETEYSFISSVFKVKNMEDLPATIRLALLSKFDTRGLNLYIDYIEKNQIDFDVVEYLLDLQQHFFLTGNLLNIEISEEQMNTFLRKHENEFTLLASEYIKKISR